MIHWSRTSQGQSQPVPSSGGAGGVGAGDATRGGGAPPTPLPMMGQMPPTHPTPPPLVAPVSPDTLALRWMTPSPVASSFFGFCSLSVLEFNLMILCSPWEVHRRYVDQCQSVRRGLGHPMHSPRSRL